MIAWRRVRCCKLLQSNVMHVSCQVTVPCLLLYLHLRAGFSAQSVFFPLYIATFNALWAAYPTLGYGLFEQVWPAPS